MHMEKVLNSYIDYYSLQKAPFGITPNIDFYCDFRGQEDIVADMIFALDNGDAFVKVTGEAGVGKTLLMWRLLADIGDQFHTCVFSSNDFSAEGLWQGVAENLGVAFQNYTPTRLIDKLAEKLLQLQQEGRRMLIVIDEAQALTDDALDALRFLLNMETQHAKLLQVVIFAQPSIDDRLHSVTFESLRQRISLSISMGPLQAKELNDYLCHRLLVAGHPSGRLFTESAQKQLFALSQGIPRIVNILCGKALLLSYQRGLPYVDINEIQHCMKSCQEMLAMQCVPKRTSIILTRMIRALCIFFIGVCCGFVYNNVTHTLFIGT